MPSVGRRTRMNVTRDAVEFVATRIVRVGASTMTARESEKRHRCHAGGAKNHAEYVEVHLSAHGSLRVLFSKALKQESPDELLVRGFCNTCFRCAIEQLVGWGF